MKAISAILISTFIFSTAAVATPSAMKLASPSKIQRLGVKLLKLTFMLPCKAESALDWSQVVMTNDDSGDMTAAVGLVYSTSESTCEPSVKLKKYELEVDPGSYGYPITKSSDSSFEAMDLAK